MSDITIEIQKIISIQRTDKIDREVLVSMLAVTSDRIFTKGQSASGGSIGRYSDAYQKTRRNKGLSGGKVILQFTQQMRNDFSVVVEGKKIGLGFKNSFNTKKSFFVEKTYKKPIFEHTKKEETLITRLYGKVIERHFN